MGAMNLPIAALLVLLPLTAAAQTPQWVVRDAEGKVVGPVLAPADGVAANQNGTDGVAASQNRASGVAATRSRADDRPLWVARRVPGQWLAILVSRNTVWSTRQRVPFLFETPDCSGQAFLDAPQQTNQASVAVVFDTQVYWPAGVGQSRPIRARGVLVKDAAECSDLLLESNLCCTLAEDEGLHFTAEVSGTAVAQLSLRPPFRIEAATVEPRY